jgi:hypothetical protein
VNENKALRQIPQSHVFVGPVQRPHSPKQASDPHSGKPHIVVPKPIGARDPSRSKVFPGLAPLQPMPSPPNEPEDLPAEEPERTELPLLHDGKGKRGAAEPIRPGDLGDPPAPEWSDGPLDEAVPMPAPMLKLPRRPAVRKPG